MAHNLYFYIYFFHLHAFMSRDLKIPTEVHENAKFGLIATITYNGIGLVLVTS
jgi:hypothetical protein